MTRPLKILIVEDSELDAELLAMQLGRSGYEAAWVRVDTADGFKRQFDAGLDVIFSDYRIPGFSGLEVLRLVKASGLDVPVIIVSGSLEEKDVAAAMQAGAADFLWKDRPGLLGEAVARALERRAAST